MITTGKFELVVKYDFGEPEIYEFDTREKAEKAEEGIEMACGEQLVWTCVRPQLVK